MFRSATDKSFPTEPSLDSRGSCWWGTPTEKYLSDMSVRKRRGNRSVLQMPRNHLQPLMLCLRPERCHVSAFVHRWWYKKKKNQSSGGCTACLAMSPFVLWSRRLTVAQGEREGFLSFFIVSVYRIKRHPAVIYIYSLSLLCLQQTNSAESQLCRLRKRSVDDSMNGSWSVNLYCLLVDRLWKAWSRSESSISPQNKHRIIFLFLLFDSG